MRWDSSSRSPTSPRSSASERPVLSAPSLFVRRPLSLAEGASLVRFPPSFSRRPLSLLCDLRCVCSLFLLLSFVIPVSLPFPIFIGVGLFSAGRCWSRFSAVSLSLFLLLPPFLFRLASLSWSGGRPQTVGNHQCFHPIQCPLIWWQRARERSAEEDGLSESLRRATAGRAGTSPCGVR